MIQWMLAIWSLVPLSFLNPVWTSVSSFTYKCKGFDPHWVAFYLLWNISITSFLYIWIYSWCSTICWKNYSFPIELSQQCYWKSANYRCMSLFLDFQFYSIDWYVYFFFSFNASKTLSLLLYLLQKFWNQGFLVLLVCSYSSRWFYLFWEIFFTCKL